MMTAAHHAIEAEQSLLGALMIDDRAIDRIEIDLRPEHFYRVEHQRIFSAMRTLMADGRSCDAITVADALERAGDIESVGGFSAVAEIEAGVASSANVRRYAEIVVERAMARGLVAAADEIRVIAESVDSSVKDRIDAAQKRIMDLSDSASIGDREPKTVADLTQSYLATVQSRWERKGGGTPTGFIDLDRRLGGGLMEGSLVIIAGRPGSGKTALALQIAANVAHGEDHSPSLVCSQEMQSAQLIDRAVSFVGRVPLAKILTGEDMSGDDHDRFTSGLSRIRSTPLFLDEQSALRLSDVRRKARRVKRSQRGKLKLVVIDYLQLMVGDKDGENRTREMTQITAGLKSLAKDLGCCVIALSQLNRQVEQRPDKRPIMADMRESGSIEQDADVILGVYRDEYYNPDSIYKGLAEIGVIKNRQGAPGGMVPMTFQGEYTAFGSLFGDWPHVEAAPENGKRKRFND